MPYFLVYFTLLFLCIAGNISKNRLFLISAFFILIVFSGFRYNVGVDYPNYVQIYNREYGYGSQELGFNLLISILHSIGTTAQMLFLVMAFLMQFFVYKIIKKYDYNTWTSVLIYYSISTFYIASFNGARQYLAIAIALWALKFIEEKKKWRFLITILVTAFFWHKSVLIFILLYPVLDKKLSIKLKIIVLLLTILCSQMLNTIISYTPYIRYLELTRDTDISSFTYIFAAFSAIILIIENKFHLLGGNAIISNLNFLCFCTLVIVFLQSNGVFIQMMLRINSYFLFPFIIIIPAIISRIHNRHYRIGAYCGLHILLVIYLFRTVYLNGETYALIPYSMNFNLFE